MLEKHKGLNFLSKIEKTVVVWLSISVKECGLNLLLLPLYYLSTPLEILSMKKRMVTEKLFKLNTYM